MKLLKEIKDGEIPEEVNERFAAKAVLFDDENKVPILFVSKKNYHKLPGGGIEDGEDKPTILKREVLKEVGSEIEVQGILGKIIEYRRKNNLLQTTYCYYGSIITKGEPEFTEEETEEGFEVKWVTIEESIKLIEQDNPDDYQGRFIQQRDIIFLKHALGLINR